MNNKEIEERISSAINASVPDMMDELAAELQLSEKAEPLLRERLADDMNDKYRKTVSHRGNLRAIMSCAAALVLMIGGITVWRSINNTVLAVVDLDVNPSIELSINKKEKVVEAKAVNAEGEDILAGMDLAGSDITVACNAIVGSVLMNGYLNDRSNSILVSVSAEDAARGREIEAQLSGRISEYMDNSSVASAILGQYVENDEELRTFAEKNGISVGKAWLIRKLMETGSNKMTEESLLALSTQELIVLSQERKVNSETVYGKADTDGYISYEDALAVSLAYAGLDGSQVSDVDIEMDCEDGRIIYEVEFRSSGHEYEFDIDATEGTSISSDTESSTAGNSVSRNDDEDEADDDRDDDEDEADDDRDDDEDEADDDRDDDEDDADDDD